jgi:hypothetical protein
VAGRSRRGTRQLAPGARPTGAGGGDDR